MRDTYNIKTMLGVMLVLFLIGQDRNRRPHYQHWHEHSKYTFTTFLTHSVLEGFAWQGLITRDAHVILSV